MIKPMFLQVCSESQIFVKWHSRFCYCCCCCCCKRTDVKANYCNFLVSVTCNSRALTCPKTDLTMGWRLESHSDAVTLSLLEARLAAAGCLGALLPGGSELRLEDEPVTIRSRGSKKSAASSVCLGELLLSRP